jgi:hypothetical protein
MLMKEFLEKKKDCVRDSKVWGTGFYKEKYNLKLFVDQEKTKFTIESKEVCNKCSSCVSNKKIIINFKEPTKLSIFQNDLLFCMWGLNVIPQDYAQYHKCVAGERFIENIKNIEVI